MATEDEFKTFAAFAEALNDEHREAFLGSIPLLIAMVVGADHEFDEAEMVAAVDALVAAEQALGPEFRRSPEAEAAFDQLSKNAREGDPLAFAGKLARLGAVVRELPEPLQRLYKTFVHDMCLHLAEASGGFLWFTSAISEEERVALHKIAAAVGVRFDEIDLEARDEDEGLSQRRAAAPAARRRSGAGGQAPAAVNRRPLLPGLSGCDGPCGRC